MPTMNLSFKVKVKRAAELIAAKEKAELYLDMAVVLLYLWMKRACPCSKSEVFRGFGI
jgi:hypothetical protein